MTQQWNPTGGRFDVEQLENINEVADLPDLAQLDEAQIYSIRSGNFAPDYVVPWAWDSTEGEYQEWRSTVDGQAIRDIPDSEVWQSLSSSAEFWEDHTTIAGFQTGGEDYWLGNDFAGEDAVDEIMNDRSSWQIGDEIDDVEQSYDGPRDIYTFSFNDVDDRWKSHLTHDGPNDNECGIWIIGSFDISNADTFNYWVSHNDNSSSSSGTALVLSKPDSSGDYEIAAHLGGSGGTGETETEDDDYDISHLDGEYEIIHMHSSNTPDNPVIEAADLYFD